MYKYGYMYNLSLFFFNESSLVLNLFLDDLLLPLLIIVPKGQKFIMINLSFTNH